MSIEFDDLDSGVLDPPFEAIRYTLYNLLKSRENLSGDVSNPYKNISMNKLLRNSGAIDMTDNHEIVDLNNGYIRIVPIDKNKKVKKEWNYD